MSGKGRAIQVQLLSAVGRVTGDYLLKASWWVTRCQDLDEGLGGAGGPDWFCFVLDLFIEA